jgi:5'-3' exonuclease
MGIPNYFKKIIDEFPNIILNSNQNIIFDNLFIDFNGCIYTAYSNIKSNKDNKLTNSEYESLIIKEVIKYTNTIIDFVKPKELIYISIDGIPPRSKMIQQRYRRYMSSWKKDKVIKELEHKNVDYNIIENYKNEWNTNAISPGTEFMKKLSFELNLYYTNNDIKVIISDDSEEGEGEFKIFNYISKLNTNKKIAIHGLDADLIMLSLLQKSNIHLIREPVFFKLESNNKFILLSIEIFKNILNTNYKNIFYNPSNIIQNYIFICFLLGNDFIVNLMFLKFKNDSLDIILDIYKKISNNIETDILFYHNNKYYINYNFLTKLIYELSLIEVDKMSEITNEHYNYKPFVKINNDDSIIKKLEIKLESYPSINKPKDKIQAGIDDNWRAKYYYYLFDTTDGDEIRDICHNYIESLEFTLEYYFEHKYHKTWYYRYQYSPTILDLFNYLQSLNYMIEEEDLYIYNKEFKIDINNEELYPDIKITNDLQLLMILPPDSKNLIKNKYHKLMEKNNSGVYHYYPKDFTISCYLKKWLWLCKPRLPDIDIKYLHSKIN